MEEVSVGVLKSPLSDFYDDVRASLLLITGISKMPEKLACMSPERQREALYHPLMAMGLPGIGKTAGIISIIRELNTKMPNGEKIGFKKIQLGQTTVGELQGIPVVVDSNVKRVTMEDLPVEERDGKYGVLFLDEVTTADEMQVQPALGLADGSRSIGVYKLPEHWLVIAAGNGPECSNFVRCDDALLSRFTVYDIAYDFRRDWRGWAHANHIDELILAFLNFAPEYIVKPVATEMDNNGMQFACPRTWTALSDELAKTTRSMSNSELKARASRIIGTQAATEFAAFAMFKDKVEQLDDHLIENILSGKVFKDKSKPVNEDMTSEMYSIVLQMLIKAVKQVIAEDIAETGADPTANLTASDYTPECLNIVANAYRWILAYQTRAVDSVIAACLELSHDVPEISHIAIDTYTFDEYCPELAKFMEDYAMEFMQSNIDLDSMRI